MRTSFIKVSLTASFLLSMQFGLAQDAISRYIEIGLQNNVVFKQKQISLEKALLSLKIANGMFSPSINLLGNYTSGEGGRSISLPVGDLLNPVYSSLNQLTGSDNFPQIENVNQNFFPHNFFDVRARASMPLLNTDLIYNRKIKENQTLLQEFEVAIYKRELVRSIKTTYFNYLGALEGVSIYKSALTRALEGMRVNESLLANGKGLSAYVLRSQSEVENIKALLVDAERQVENTQLYFNFLLNRDQNEAVDSSYEIGSDIARAASLLQENISISRREELMQVQTLQGVNENILSMSKLFWSPKVSGFLDLGAQAENFNYNSKAKYYLVGVQLDMSLFTGFTNRHKIAQSKLEIRNTELSSSNISQQLTMSTQVARNGLVTAYQNYLSAQKQFEAAQSYQRLIDKGYKEGINTFIEALDARNQLTSAQLQVALNQYRVLIAEANYERETATYSFN
jgi:outer membrane protein